MNLTLVTDSIFYSGVLLFQFAMLIFLTNKIYELYIQDKNSRNKHKFQVVLAKVIQILLKADGVVFLLYYYSKCTHDDMSEIYENCISCKLLIWDTSVYALFIICRVIAMQVAPRWISNIPLRFSLMKKVRGQYTELFGISFLAYSVVSFICSLIVGYLSVYFKSWTANILVGLSILSLIKAIQLNEFYYTQILIYTFLLYNNIKQVFGICGMITIDMNSSLLKRITFSERVRDGAMVIRTGLGDILMVCIFAVLFLEIDFGSWRYIYCKFQLKSENKHVPDDNERDMEYESKPPKKNRPSSCVRMPKYLETTANLDPLNTLELSKASEESNMLLLSNDQLKNNTKGKKKMVKGKWVQINYC